MTPGCRLGDAAATIAATENFSLYLQRLALSLPEGADSTSGTSGA